MAHDSARGVTVLYGGWDGASYSGETWEWDGMSWTLAATTGPPPRRGHAMTYDSTRAMCVLFGGTMGGRETWEWEAGDKRVRRTMGIASLGGATLDNEENYLIKKLFTALGAIQIENQARI